MVVPVKQLILVGAALVVLNGIRSLLYAVKSPLERLIDVLAMFLAIYWLYKNWNN